MPLRGHPQSPQVYVAMRGEKTFAGQVSQTSSLWVAISTASGDPVKARIHESEISLRFGIFTGDYSGVVVVGEEREGQPPDLVIKQKPEVDDPLGILHRFDVFVACRSREGMIEMHVACHSYVSVIVAVVTPGMAFVPFLAFRPVDPQSPQGLGR